MKNASIFLMQWDKENLPFKIWINTSENGVR